VSLSSVICNPNPNLNLTLTPTPKNERQEETKMYEQFVVIGTDESIARRHAVIYWVSSEAAFFIQNISTESHNTTKPNPNPNLNGYNPDPNPDPNGANPNPNGPNPNPNPNEGKGGSVFIMGQELYPGDRGVRLESQTVVQVGSIIFTFLLPIHKSRELPGSFMGNQDIDVSARVTVRDRVRDRVRVSFSDTTTATFFPPFPSL
jgi:hypothetical protein